MLSGVVAVLFPPECVLCRRPVEEIRPVCDRCLPEATDLVGWRCRSCGDALGLDADLCLECATRDRGFSSIVSLGSYDGPWGRLVHALKFDRERAVASFLGERLAERIRELGLDGSFDVVTFVPMTREERRSRGFNHARELARVVAKQLGVPLCRSLEKTRVTKPQRTLAAGARRDNLQGAFRELPSQGRRVLLVDDICTTGWTLETCARTLRRAGAVIVVGLTVARA